MPTSAGEFGVVMVAYNSFAVIQTAIRSVRAVMPKDTKIVIVDNGSTELLDQQLGEQPLLTVLRLEENLGYGAAANIGVESNQASSILILNPDAELVEFDAPRIPPRGIRAAMDRADDGVETPLLQPRLNAAVELLWSWAAWLVVPRELDWKRPSRLASGTRLDGAAFLIQRTEFRALGGFDDRFFLYYEDDDLSRRYDDASLPVSGTAAIVVRHIRGTSSPRVHERVVAWALMSQVELVAKRSGAKRARITARVALLLLSAISLGGVVLGRFPGVGPRASDKRVSAKKIVEHLAREALRPPRANAYPVAAPLFAELTHGLQPDSNE